jgi:thioredoxin-like negative regulator of GroEL
LPKLPAAELPKKQPAEPEPPKAWQNDTDRLIGLGMAAFKNQEYGLAAMRFRQAHEADPMESKPHFYLAQANVALGKFRAAVAAIEDGLRRQPNWPLAQFQPRLDMYQGIEDEWLAHKKQLEVVHAGQPEHPAYAFLTAYLLWFDNERDQAAHLFRKIRPLVQDPTFIDAFLKVAQEVAAK